MVAVAIHRVAARSTKASRGPLLAKAARSFFVRWVQPGPPRVEKAMVQLCNLDVGRHSICRCGRSM